MMVRAQNILMDPSFRFLPAMAKDSAQKTSKTLLAMKGEAETNMKSGTQLSFTLKDVQDVEADFRNKAKLAVDIFISIGKCQT